MIVDFHIHLGDILFGRGIDHPFERAPRFFTNLFEWSGFRLRGRQPQRAVSLLRFCEAIHNQLRNNLAVPENAIRSMDQAGIDVSIAMPIEPHRTTAENLAVQRTAARLLTFASVHPDDARWREKLHEYMRAGARGLKINPIIQRVHPSSAAVAHVLEEFAPYGLPVLFHTGPSSYYVVDSPARQYGWLRNYLEVIRRFPRVRIVLAHMGMMETEAALQYVAHHPNVFVETSFQSAAIIRAAINRVGSERVLFASDWPFALQPPSLRAVERATRGRPAVADRVLYRNAQALIGPLG